MQSDGGTLGVGARQQQEELLAAPTDQDVTASGAGANAFRSLLQRLVAGIVAEVVVDLLEVVEIDEGKRKWRVGAGRSTELEVEKFLAAAPGKAARQAVAHRLAHQDDDEAELRGSGHGGDAGDQCHQPE